MQKIIMEFAPEPFLQRRIFWENNLVEFSKVKFVDVMIAKEELQKSWKSLFKRMDAAIVAESYSQIFFDILPQINREVREVKKIDSLFKVSAGWSELCLMREVLHEEIISRVPRLDNRAIAYLVGSGTTMRVGMSVLNQLGYQVVCLVVDDESQVESSLIEMKRYFFNLDIRVMINSDLTLQPNNGSILLNTVRLEGREELITDLSYLNFIREGGLVVDTSLLPIEHQLLEESRNVGLSCISGVEIRAYCDWLFLKKVFGQVSLSKAEYVRKFVLHMKEAHRTKIKSKV